METLLLAEGEVWGDSFQPTYKEWKPVPGKGKGHHQVVFPAYLQGMEIEIPEEAKTFVKLVPSLPTRNGNNTSEKVFVSPLSVPSLPTRNGN